jgi:type I thyroxine 5'-deiodinase
LPAVHELYAKYGASTEFFLVYIREAHASDAWQLESNARDGVVHRTPQSDGERCGLAQSCVSGLKVEFPALVDGMDNATDQAWCAWPERLFLIDRDGRIAYLSAPGPFGFEPAGLGAALQAMHGL